MSKRYTLLFLVFDPISTLVVAVTERVDTVTANADDAATLRLRRINHHPICQVFRA